MVNKRTISLLSVVFSFRNEEEVLPECIKRIRAVLRSEVERGHINAYELIFVDDASTDRSWEVLEQHAQGHEDIKILRTSRRFGPSPSPCVLAGMEHASGDALVYMDVDLQDPPEVIPELIQVWRDDPSVDVIHTRRKSRKGESKLKLLVTRIGYFILNKVTSVKLPIEVGDFKLLSRRVVDHLIQLREKKPFLRGLVCWVGFKQVFVPYDREPRHQGKTKFFILGADVINNFLDSALISFSSTPLKLSILLGFLTAFIDIWLVVYVLLEKLNGVAIPGWAAIMVTVVFIGSVQLLCMGILGLYLSAIFDEVKRRPNYILDKTFGFKGKTSMAYSGEKIKEIFP